MTLININQNIEIDLFFAKDDTYNAEISAFESFLVQIKQVCFIALPTLDQLYTFEKNIGKGSQATIDLYKVNSKNDGTKVAVKTYFMDDDKFKRDDLLKMIINEIHFLRDLYLCENFISLESVHRE